MELLHSSFAKTETKLQNLNPRLIIPLGVLTGSLLGIIARLWMRWISTDPEFSWSGSIFIVMAFTLFFTAHSTVFFAVRKGWSRRSMMVARTGAIMFSLPTFSAAGAIMLPTILLGSLAVWRKNLPKWVRIILGIASLAVPVITIKDIGSDFGWGVATFGRILLFVFIYSALIAVTQSTVTKFPGGKQRSRRQTVGLRAELT